MPEDGEDKVKSLQATVKEQQENGFFFLDVHLRKARLKQCNLYTVWFL